MLFVRTLFATGLLAVSITGPPDTHQEGSFIVRLGNDTTAVEHYSRTEKRVEVDQVGRAPRVRLRHFVYDLGSGGELVHFSMRVTAPGAAESAPPLQTIEAHFAGDSLQVHALNGTTAQDQHFGVPSGTVVVPLSSPWVVYEGLSLHLSKVKADSLHATMFILGGSSPDWLTLRRLGRDSVEIVNGHGDLFHAHVDRAGHVLGVKPLAGTGKFSLERVKKLDLAELAAEFDAREKQGGGLGMLSPRDTVRFADSSGTSMWIDYGRPAKRGRQVFGGIVPWGEVWRTGANAATQFKTEKALVMNGVEVPAGFYSLWSVPTPQGWKLVVNGETGQWGTEHKSEKDLYTIDLQVSTLPQPVERFTIAIAPNPGGGVVHLDWDTMRGSLPFTVKP